MTEFRPMSCKQKCCVCVCVCVCWGGRFIGADSAGKNLFLPFCLSPSFAQLDFSDHSSSNILGHELTLRMEAKSRMEAERQKPGVLMTK